MFESFNYIFSTYGGSNRDSGLYSRLPTYSYDLTRIRNQVVVWVRWGGVNHSFFCSEFFKNTFNNYNIGRAGSLGQKFL